MFYITFDTSNRIDESVVVNNEEEQNNLLVLPVEENNLTYKGVIRESEDGSQYQYTLNTDDKVVLYLKSSNQDLSLLRGLDVEVVGDIDGRFETIAVMNVKSVKLK